MNRFLVIPLVLFVATFAMVAINQPFQSSHANEGGMDSGELDRLWKIKSESKLLSLEAAQELVEETLGQRHENYRMLSRAYVRPVETMTVQFDLLPEKGAEEGMDSADSQYFLGTASLVSKQAKAETSTVLPIAVDRASGQVYVHAGSAWVQHDKWYPRVR